MCKQENCTTKQCSICLLEKKVIDFNKSKYGKFGISPYCRNCDNLKRRQLSKKYRNNVKEVTKKTKICSKCEVEKPIEEFRNNKDEKDGKYHYCRLCHDKHVKEWSLTESGIYSRYKRNCKYTKKEFRLNFEDFIKLINKPCFYCKEKKSSGIDRINNNIGYILENCVSCCWVCNDMKGKLHKEKFLEQVKKIYFCSNGEFDE